MELAEFKKTKKEFMKKAQIVLADEFKKFFTKYPEIDAIKWTQYTPYFNDGDICTFSRHEFRPRVVHTNQKSNEAGEAELIVGLEADEEGFYDPWDIRDTPLDVALDFLHDTFEDTDDVFKTAFGDGVQVVATRSGFEVDEYTHD